MKTEDNSPIGRAMNISLYNEMIVSGKGCVITNEAGQDFIDLLSGASVNVMGYANKALGETYYNSCMRLQHICVPYTMNPTTIELANKMIEITPGNFQKKVLFGLSGSDSVAGAIKAARKYTGRSGVISFKNSYHGSVDSSFHATHWKGLKDGLPGSTDHHYLDFPAKSCPSQRISAITEDFIRLVKTKKIGAVLIEAIQGDSGVHPIDQSFLHIMKSVCSENNIVIIDDEIQAGMGRTGSWWAIDHFDIVPDIVVVGKSLSAGYAPISLVVGKAEIIDSLGKAQHVFTYSGHPPSCAVSLKNIDLIEQQNLISTNSEKGRYFINSLKQIDSQIVKRVDGMGLLIGVELIHQNRPMASLVGLKCRNKGVYVGYYGTENEVLRIAPPYIISREQIDKSVAVIEESLKEIERGEISPEERDYLKKCTGLGG